MASKTEQLHFLLIPFLSQSNILPITNFAKLLAKRGLTVSIITTPANVIRSKPALDQAVQAGLKIKMMPLEFPGQECGLPPGCENMDPLPSMSQIQQFFQACMLMQGPLEKMISELDPKPNCIIASNFLTWTLRVSEKFSIPWYVFEAISCFTLICSYTLSQDRIKERLVSDSGTIVVPDVPDKIEFREEEFPGQGIQKISDQIREVRGLARATLVNSFEEMEGGYLERYREKRERVWCIGPVSLCDSEGIDRGKKASVDKQDNLLWLDMKKPASVIYACFGSLCHLSPEQIMEIGSGLEASNFPFIWVIGGLDSSPEVEIWLAEEEFEKKVEGRGLIVRGWAPQVQILSHPAVGGFLTHCGWNSTLEGVSAGVPMITWPMFAEQFYNEKFIIHVVKIGVTIGEECGKKGLVKCNEIKKSIEKLMDENEEGKERRKRAQKLGEMAKKALEEGGSSYKSISLLIQDVTQLASSRN